MLSLIKKSLALLLIVLLHNSCARFWEPKSFGTVTINLHGIFPNCYTTSSGTTHITFKGKLQVYYYKSSSDRRDGDHASFTSGTDPIVVSVQVPNDGTEFQLIGLSNYFASPLDFTTAI
ncbi:MAG: hypothetical protein Q8927_18540, partial [Bacteroidota bacterium]|nr:hypothetical protein [Bacteroidota bacterium]